MSREKEGSWQNRLQGKLGVSLLLLTGMLMAGCTRVGPTTAPSKPLTDPLAISGADLERNTEVQMVEQMALYRGNYQKYLEMLIEFYDQQGNHMKSTWAKEEMEHLKSGPRREYLVIAEVAGPDLRASQSIVQADVLYKEGLELMKQAQSGLAGLMVDKKKLYAAKDKFNDLITNYPDSDKIDDAAFQIGQIYNHYLKDYTRALLYYQRVWQWDPQTPLPARFQVARIYDDRLHDRIKAIEYYSKAINLESAYPENVVYAQRRIQQLNEEMSQP